MPRKRSATIRSAILTEVFWKSDSPVSTIAKQFDLTSQAIQLHTKNLVENGDLAAIGEKRHRHYGLIIKSAVHRDYSVGASLTEDRVWDDFVHPSLTELQPNGIEIFHYGLTEMVNNVIDHSEAKRVRIELLKTAISVTVKVWDNGVGLFAKIARALNLPDLRQSFLELSKGKFTTDPKRHTGEGLFFTSRVFDRLTIRSAKLWFSHSQQGGGWTTKIEEDPVTLPGTILNMELLVPSARQLKDVFSEYSSGPEDYRFAKTKIPLRLASFGDESLLSRSSAKRVLARIDQFDQVILEFAGVSSIGPAFADEIFRVFVREHPNVELIPINANEQVTQMIRRAKSSER